MGAYYQYCTEGGHPRRSGRLGKQGAGRGGCRECRNKPLKLIMKGKGSEKWIKDDRLGNRGVGVYAGSVGGIFGLFRCRTNGYGLR